MINALKLFLTMAIALCEKVFRIEGQGRCIRGVRPGSQSASRRQMAHDLTDPGGECSESAAAVGAKP